MFSSPFRGADTYYSMAANEQG